MTVNNISVFPNPSTGLFTLQNLENVNTIEVYDMAGKLIHQSVATQATTTIDLGGKEQGIYFYKIIQGAAVVQQGKLAVM